MPESVVIDLSSLEHILRTATCPACGYHVAVPFYDGGCQPLTTVAWPASSEEAQSMKRLPLDFVRCIDCGHVYNTQFNYSEVPYSEKPNLMYNQGSIWAKHLEEVCRRIVERLPENPVVIEIGCGEGHLLRSLKERCPKGRFIGFDLNAAINTNDGQIEGYQQLFDPSKHLSVYRPHMIISRHVLEHLMNPLGFVQSVAFAASWLGVETQLFIEVPCIDRTFDTYRVVDFFYEHNSHFTTASLRKMLLRSTSHVDLVERGYNDEVVYGFARVGANINQNDIAQQALAFLDKSAQAKETITGQLAVLCQSGKRVAIWGGTGKAAAFINRYEVDSQRFPLVVDSDLNKVGTFVPGTGQQICEPAVLNQQPADVIIITTQWRASDIALEMTQRAITCDTVLIEHEGKLIDYFKDAHPYRFDAGSR